MKNKKREITGLSLEEIVRIMHDDTPIDLVSQSFSMKVSKILEAENSIQEEKSSNNSLNLTGAENSPSS